MFDFIKEALPALQTDTAEYSTGVQIWIRVMAASFFGGIIFVGVSRRSLWIVGMALVTLSSLIVGKLLLPAFSRGDIGTVVHLVVWPVAVLLLWWPRAKSSAVHPSVMVRLFGYWKYWVTFLIAVSLMLDFKTLIGWIWS